jgi:hypothetical protein
VLVAGDDVIKPILGYSDNGNYDENNLPPAFVYWMDCLQEDIEYAIENNLPQSDEVGMAWDAYLDSNGSYDGWRATNVVVPPLVATRWNQTSPYNEKCPILPGTSTRGYTGCVATTMAQIMKYHGYPSIGKGQSDEYKTNSPSNIIIPAVPFNVNYQWGQMTNTYSGSSSSTAIDAVATLMYHCGVSVEMDYQSGGSGASSEAATKALINNFDYDANLQLKYRAYYNNTTWEAMLIEQLNGSLPIYYAGRNAGSGHAFVCDGYAQNGYFHFNWGWGGSQDGYYLTTAMQPGTGNPGAGAGTYNLGQNIIINIKPDCGGIASPEMKVWCKMSCSF